MGASCSKSDDCQRTKKPRARGNWRQVGRSTSPQQQASEAEMHNSGGELQFQAIVSEGDSSHRRPEENHRSVTVPTVVRERGQRNPLHPLIVTAAHTNSEAPDAPTTTSRRIQPRPSPLAPLATIASRGAAAHLPETGPPRNNSHSSDPHSSATDSASPRNRDDSSRKENFSVASRFSSTNLESATETRIPRVPGEAFDRPPQLQRFISAENSPVETRPLQAGSSPPPHVIPLFIDLAGSNEVSSSSGNRGLVRMAHLDAFGDDDSFQTAAPSIDDAVIAGLRGTENESESNSSIHSDLEMTKSTLSCAQTRTPSLRSSTITDLAPSQVEPSPRARVHSTSDSNPLGSPRTRLANTGMGVGDAESMVSALVPVD